MKRALVQSGMNGISLGARGEQSVQASELRRRFDGVSNPRQRFCLTAICENAKRCF
jgi:hypothetical protein